MKILNSDKQHSCGKGGCIVGYILPTENCSVKSYTTNVEYDLEKKFITIHALPIKGYQEEEEAYEEITIETPNGQYTVRFNYSWNNEPIPSQEQLVMSISPSSTNQSNSQTTITAYYITPEGEQQDVDSVTITAQSSALTVTGPTKNNYAYTYNVSTSQQYGTYTVTFKATKQGTKQLSASKTYTVNLGSQPEPERVTYIVQYKCEGVSLQGGDFQPKTGKDVVKNSSTKFTVPDGTFISDTTITQYITPSPFIVQEDDTYDYLSVTVSGTTITFNYTKRTPTTTYQFGYGGAYSRMPAPDELTEDDISYILNNTTYEYSSSRSWSKTWNPSDHNYSTLWFVYPEDCKSFSWKDSFENEVSPRWTIPTETMSPIIIGGITYKCTYKSIQGSFYNNYTINIS